MADADDFMRILLEIQQALQDLTRKMEAMAKDLDYVKRRA